MNPKYVFLSPPIHLALGWLMIGAVVVLSLIPGTVLPSAGFTFEDKIAHALTYAALAFWFAVVIARPKHRRLAALLFLLGVCLEICQSLSPYRFASVADALANAFGIALGFAAVYWLTRRRSTGSH